jgi:hypothetical protein
MNETTVPQATDGRRYRIRDKNIPDEHKQVFDRRVDLEDGRSVVVRVEDADDSHRLIVPSSWLEPVGLDMAEPADGTVVRVTWQDGGHSVVAERFDKGAPPSGENWHETTGLKYSWHEFTSQAVSITVLEPRRQVEPVTLPLTVEATSKRLPKVFLEHSQLPEFAARLALHGPTDSISRTLLAVDARTIAAALVQLADEWDAERDGGVS